MKHSQVLFNLQYAELTIAEIIEVKSYPFLEMINELAGFVGLCFGISVVSFASLYDVINQRVPRKNAIVQLQLSMLELAE